MKTILLALALSMPVVAQIPPKTPDIHFTPTRQGLADAMLKLAEVTANDVVYDLGSGDGRIVMLAAQKYGGRGVGMEIDKDVVGTGRRVDRVGPVAVGRTVSQWGRI